MAIDRTARMLATTIAALLRRASSDRDDSLLLRGRGRRRNAALLLGRGIEALCAALAASERGRADPPAASDLAALSRRNPLRDGLTTLGDAVAALGEESPEVPLDAAIGKFGRLLDHALHHFGVSPGSAEPVAEIRPPRLEPKMAAPPACPEPKPVSTATTRPERRPLPEPVPTPGRVKAPATRLTPIVLRKRTQTPATSSDVASEGAPPRRPTVRPNAPDAPSAVFWALMDRWRMEDEASLRLLGREPRLTRAGGRPRFRVRGREALILSLLQEIDQALLTLGETPSDWLRRPVASLPFGGRAPLARIADAGPEGAADTLRLVARAGLTRSL